MFLSKDFELIDALFSNSMKIPFDERHFALMTEFFWRDASPEEWRWRYARDRYLLLRGVLDAEMLWNLRARYFSLFSANFLRAGTAPREGIYSGDAPKGLPPYGTEGHPAFAFVRSEDFQRFADDPALTRIAEILLEGPVERIARSPLRHFYRGTRNASRAHIDRTYLAVPEDRFLTFWISFGDCRLADGGLVYLENSHQLDVEELRRITPGDRPGDQRPISHDLAEVARTTGRRWLWTDIGAGDLLVHHPDLVHASVSSQTDRMRLSTDLRFAAKEGTMDTRWDTHWSADDGH